MDERLERVPSGYLHRNFQLFHLKDQVERVFDFHYHDFYKIVVFLGGRSSYIIEGKSYELKPWDILLVNSFDVHKPVIDASVPYERIIIWVHDAYMHSYVGESTDISACFKKATARSFNLVRLAPEFQDRLRVLLSDLEKSLHSEEFAASLLSDALFIQFMVYLNRIFLGKHYIHDGNSLSYDSHIEETIKYINTHLNADLSVDTLASRCFVSKYSLMRNFKSATGYTLHNYITSKRLLNARTQIHNGIPILQAASACGFNDYTTFSRAYKKLFGHAPSQETGL